jgi:hypothetical protein
MAKAGDFRAELEAQIDRAQKQGRPHAEINAGELHRVVGGYPSAADNSMPFAAMLCAKSPKRCPPSQSMNRQAERGHP